jgi:hypothetical protein
MKLGDDAFCCVYLTIFFSSARHVVRACFTSLQAPHLHRRQQHSSDHGLNNNQQHHSWCKLQLTTLICCAPCGTVKGPPYTAHQFPKNVFSCNSMLCGTDLTCGCKLPPLQVMLRLPSQRYLATQRV